MELTDIKSDGLYLGNLSREQNILKFQIEVVYFYSRTERNAVLHSDNGNANWIRVDQIWLPSQLSDSRARFELVSTSICEAA